ncbi:hypothetical protein MIND_00405400 [Mycena indigotica]|uniref:Uncharacterized protein n=1 Tax=Mycena indigotica TaxID=2126181 RepID=A0A8H6T3H2_9AGAR|nr:uncharacterized protein MIND_00405400 [Mycena indigotica]KAF7310313.1 hypothetical protein MIND_00405400 [Mycena indigotica]
MASRLPLLSLPAAMSSSNDGCETGANCRTQYDIIWGCLITIFACVWVSVHPNLPARPSGQQPDDGDSFWVRWRWLLVEGTYAFRARMKLMLVGLLAPELIAGFALRQRVMAGNFSQKLLVSRTHGFFICMGGFVDEGRHPIVTWGQITGASGFYRVPKPHILQRDAPPTLLAIKQTTRSFIMDKSKGDVVTKAVAFSQGAWFIAQCIARLVQHLPFTQLEVATLAFAVVNIFTWVLWWDKPLDVQEPLVITAGPEVSEPYPRDGPPDKANAFVTGFVRLMGLAHTKDAWSPETEFSVPTFWFATWSDTPAEMETLCVLGELGIACIFGAIHCAAWNSIFLSGAEKWLWRISSIFLTGAPLAAMFLSRMSLSHKNRTMMWVIVLLYVPIRLLPLVLPFAALRGLTGGDFIDVNWSIYIPHL